MDPFAKSGERPKKEGGELQRTLVDYFNPTGTKTLKHIEVMKLPNPTQLTVIPLHENAPPGQKPIQVLQSPPWLF